MHFSINTSLTSSRFCVSVETSYFLLMTFFVKAWLIEKATDYKIVGLENEWKVVIDAETM